MVSVILIEGLCLGHLKVVRPHLLGVEQVELIFGEVVHDACPVRVSDDIDRRSEAVPVGLNAETDTRATSLEAEK